MESLIRDVRLALRSLGRSPAFTAVAVLCLAVGIGVTSAIFSIVHAVLLRPLPYADPDRVVMIYEEFRGRELERQPVSGYEFFDIRDRNESFTGVAGLVTQFMNRSGTGEPERLVGARVSHELFPLLGVRMHQGRAFSPEEDVYGNNQVALISYEYWRRAFGGDPAAVGGKLVLDGQPVTVVGVLPEGFNVGLVAYDVWVPIAINLANLPPRHARGLTLVARLAAGVSPAQAQEDMTRLAGRMAAEYPDVYPADSGFGIAVVPALDDLIGDARPVLFALFGAVALVLLIACANVANLLLARATAREKEVGIRTALGAGRGQLMRRFLIEGVILSLSGALLGLLLAIWLPKILIAVNPTRMPRLDEVSLSPAVLGFTLATAVATGILFGMVPALRAFSSRLTEVLKEGGKTSDGGSRGGGVRAALVAAEIAVAVLVLIGAGLLVQSFRGLQEIDPGFAVGDRLTFRLFLPPNRYPDADRAALVARLAERLEAVAGVEQVGVVSHLPLGAVNTEGEVEVEGRALRAQEGNPQTGWRMVSPGYFETMGIDLVAGAAFDATHDAAAPGVVILDRRLANRLFPEGRPLGRRINLLRFDGREDWRTVIGVVAPIQDRSLVGDGGDQLYVPYAQFPFPVVSLVLATAVAPDSLAPAVRQAVFDLDRDLPVLELQSMDDYVAAAISEQRLAALLFGAFALVALLLTVAGVYGVMAYSVARRTREIGVRVALGATRKEIAGLVLRRALVLAAVGIAAGVVAAFALVRTIESLLYGVSGTDWATYGAAALGLGLLALVASLVPARRATRIDPQVALRYE